MSHSSSDVLDDFAYDEAVRQGYLLSALLQFDEQECCLLPMLHLLGFDHCDDPVDVFIRIINILLLLGLIPRSAHDIRVMIWATLGLLPLSKFFLSLGFCLVKKLERCFVIFVFELKIVAPFN